MRKSTVTRKTSESDITVNLNLDGQGEAKIDTGVPFFDHMLTQVAFHGELDLEISAKGDLEVDDHHTVEDVGIVFGQALVESLGDKKGITRYGSSLLPMDEVLARVVIDVSGRSCLVYNVEYRREMIGALSTENVQEFFRAVIRESGITLHVDILTPGNDHHQVEAIFKGFGRALREAITVNPDRDIPSTKGSL